MFSEAPKIFAKNALGSLGTVSGLDIMVIVRRGSGDDGLRETSAISIDCRLRLGSNTHASLHHLPPAIRALELAAPVVMQLLTGSHMALF